MDFNCRACGATNGVIRRQHNHGSDWSNQQTIQTQANDRANDSRKDVDKHTFPSFVQTLDPLRVHFG